MASIGNAFKVSGAIAAQTTGSATLYTCPANSFAIVQLGGRSSGGNYTATLGGVDVTFAYGAAIHVGPGQSIVVTSISPGYTVFVSGVQFTNS